MPVVAVRSLFLALLAAAAGALAEPAIPVAPSPDAWLQVGRPDDAYWLVDNRWGHSNITEGPGPHQFEQAVGASPAVGPGGEVSFRMRWRWPNPPGAREVKGYPAILSGRKPGYYSTNTLVGGRPVRLPDGGTLQQAPTGHTPGTIFPVQLPVRELKARFDYRHLQQPTGQGHLVFDIWLQARPQQDNGFGNASITHEIMVPLDLWGSYGAHAVPGGRKAGWYDHDAVIGGRRWHVYATKGPDGCLRPTFGGLNGRDGRTGWKMIAFVPADLPVAAGEIDLAALVNHVATRRDRCGQPWASGREYVSSVELGVEPVSGSGDMVVEGYKLWGAGTRAPTAPSPAAIAGAPPARLAAAGACSAPPWSPGALYSTGQQVVHEGQLFTARGVNFTRYAPGDTRYWSPGPACARP